MMTKIKILVLAFMLPIFMAGCSSSSGGGGRSIDGGTLSYATLVAGTANEADFVQYQYYSPAGGTYTIDLYTYSGDADLGICEVECGVWYDNWLFESSFPGTGYDSVTVNLSGPGWIYIAVEGYAAGTSVYDLVIY